MDNKITKPSWSLQAAKIEPTHALMAFGSGGSSKRRRGTAAPHAADMR